jgi:hypothetical protein
VSYCEGFAAGIMLTHSAYELALAEVERQGKRRARLVKTMRVKAQTELFMRLSIAMTGASAAAANVSSGNAPGASSAFNAAFPILLKFIQVGVETKLDLLKTAQEIVEPSGWKLCRYCGRVLEQSENLRAETCPPPARCRKGLQNRRAYLRRKKEIVYL